MELELPAQRKCFAGLNPQTFGMFELGKITFGLSQTSIIFQTTICKVKRKADIVFSISQPSTCTWVV